MTNGIVLDESFLTTCFFCGGKTSGEIYDFYCSKECEKKDEERIDKAINKGQHPIEIMHNNITKAIKKTA